MSSKPSSGLLHGKVANILNARELTINLGQEDGVKIGMIFKILADSPVAVFDPDTNEKLGEVDREKIRVKVSELNDKFSVCKTYRTKGSGLALSMFDLMIDRQTIETLKASDASFPPPLPEEESFVKKGDRVIQVVDGD